MWNDGSQDIEHKSMKDRSLRNGKQRRWALQLTHLTACWVLRPWCKERNPQSLAASLNWGDETGNLGWARWLEFTGQYWKEEWCTKRGLQRSAETPPQIFSWESISEYMWASYLRQRKNPLGRMKGYSAWSSHEARSSACPNRLENHIIQKSSARVL